MTNREALRCFGRSLRDFLAAYGLAGSHRLERRLRGSTRDRAFNCRESCSRGETSRCTTWTSERRQGWCHARERRTRREAEGNRGRRVLGRRLDDVRSNPIRRTLRHAHSLQRAGGPHCAFLRRFLPAPPGVPQAELGTADRVRAFFLLGRNRALLVNLAALVCDQRAAAEPSTDVIASCVPRRPVALDGGWRQLLGPGDVHGLRPRRRIRRLRL